MFNGLLNAFKAVLLSCTAGLIGVIVVYPSYKDMEGRNSIGVYSNSMQYNGIDPNKPSHETAVWIVRNYKSDSKIRFYSDIVNSPFSIIGFHAFCNGNSLGTSKQDQDNIITNLRKGSLDNISIGKDDYFWLEIELKRNRINNDEYSKYFTFTFPKGKEPIPSLVLLTNIEKWGLVFYGCIFGIFLLFLFAATVHLHERDRLV